MKLTQKTEIGCIVTAEQRRLVEQLPSIEGGLGEYFLNRDLDILADIKDMLSMLTDTIGRV